jgi:purine-binding chemotaxis protein CheW
MSEEANSKNRYLVFRLNEDLYGTPLLGVREVVEFQQPKPIPNTAPWFSGIINIRGEIIGVIDLRSRFEYPHRNQISLGLALILFQTDIGTVAAVVDKIESVKEFTENNIEKNPGIAARVPMNYLIGIGQAEKQMINLIDLNQVLSKEEFIQFHRIKSAA